MTTTTSSISIPTMHGASFHASRSLSLKTSAKKGCSFSNDALLKKRGRKSFARSRSTSSSRDGVVVTHASSSSPSSSFAKSETLFWPESRRQGIGRRTMTTTATLRTTETTKTEAIGRNESRSSSNSRSRSRSRRRIRRNKAIFDSRDEDKESATKAATTAAAVDSSP